MIDNAESPIRYLGMHAALAVFIASEVALVCGVAAMVAIGVISCGLVTIEAATSPLAIVLFVLLVCVILSVVISAAVHTTIIKPVRVMTKAMESLAQGDFDVRISAEDLGRTAVREVRDFSQSFNTAAKELSSVEVMKSNFISDFSHELRTPIASIAGFSQLLRDPGLTSKEREDYLSVIEEESIRLTNLSERILLLSRMEAKAVLTDTGRVDVAEQLRRAVLLLEEKFANKNVTVSMNLDECEIQGSADYLFQLWLNLLDNAIKFSPFGGTVSIALYGGSLSDDGRFTGGSQAVCWISDEGCGMDELTREHLFDKFYQGDTSHSTEGNGLGLPLCKKVVELHGGTISVDSRAQGGTVFEVRLPVS